MACGSVCVGAVFKVRRQHPVLKFLEGAWAPGAFLRNLVVLPAIALFGMVPFASGTRAFAFVFLHGVTPHLPLPRPPSSWPSEGRQRHGVVEGGAATWDLGPTGMLYVGKWAGPSKGPREGMQFLERHRGSSRVRGAAAPMRRRSPWDHGKGRAEKCVDEGSKRPSPEDGVVTCLRSHGVFWEQVVSVPPSLTSHPSNNPRLWHALRVCLSQRQLPEIADAPQLLIE